MGKLLIACLNLLGSYLMTSCTRDHSAKEIPSQYDSIVSYFKLRQHFDIKSTTRKLFVLTENGCVTCNKKFASLVETNLSNPSSLILLVAQGNIVNTKIFDGAKNVLFDQSVAETEYKIFSQSKVIYFRSHDRGIDTIITIDARSIDRQFDIIHNRK